MADTPKTTYLDEFSKSKASIKANDIAKPENAAAKVITEQSASKEVETKAAALDALLASTPAVKVDEVETLDLKAYAKGLRGGMSENDAYKNAQSGDEKIIKDAVDDAMVDQKTRQPRVRMGKASKPRVRAISIEIKALADDTQLLHAPVTPPDHLVSSIITYSPH